MLDATDLKQRQGGRIVSAAATIAVAAHSEGRRGIIGLDVGPSEAETFWLDFLRPLRARGLKGVKLVISDAHTGLKAAISRVFDAAWRRCRAHFIYVTNPSVRTYHWARRGRRPRSSSRPSPRRAATQR